MERWVKKTTRERRGSDVTTNCLQPRFYCYLAHEKKIYEVLTPIDCLFNRLIKLIVARCGGGDGSAPVDKRQN